MTGSAAVSFWHVSITVDRSANSVVRLLQLLLKQLGTLVRLDGINRQSFDLAKGVMKVAIEVPERVHPSVQICIPPFQVEESRLQIWRRRLVHQVAAGAEVMRASIQVVRHDWRAGAGSLSAV